MDSKGKFPFDRRKAMMRYYLRSSISRKLSVIRGSKMKPIVISFRGNTIRISKYRLLHETNTSKRFLHIVFRESMESKISSSYCLLLRTIMDSYPIDPEKGITIINPIEQPIEPNPNEDKPVIDLPALGSILTKEEFLFLRDCIEKNIDELDYPTRKHFIGLLIKLLPLVEKNLKEESAKAETSKITETESDELDQHKDSKEK